MVVHVFFEQHLPVLRIAEKYDAGSRLDGGIGPVFRNVGSRRGQFHAEGAERIGVVRPQGQLCGIGLGRQRNDAVPQAVEHIRHGDPVLGPYAGGTCRTGEAFQIVVVALRTDFGNLPAVRKPVMAHPQVRIVALPQHFGRIFPHKGEKAGQPALFDANMHRAFHAVVGNVQACAFLFSFLHILRYLTIRRLRYPASERMIPHGRPGPGMAVSKQ